jgi:diguanylate cyclase (GGDEF)-like protein
MLADSAAALCLAHGSAVGAAVRGRLRSRSGGSVVIEDAAFPVVAADGRVTGAVLQFRVAGAQQQWLRALRWQASHDALTGLANRDEFERRAGAALQCALREGRVHALLYMDLDRFKHVNDRCGHAAGDELLRLVARLLQALMRDSDVLARLGGDELGVLLADCPLAQACAIAEQIRAAIADFRFVWGMHSFQLGISIGLVQVGADSATLASVLGAADQACYRAKEQGRNRLHVHVAVDGVRRRDDAQWRARLGAACDTDLFSLHMMPIRALGAGPSHHEVLLRLADGRGGLLLPGAFLPAAERHDLMRAIDRWVVRTVCTQAGGHAGASPLVAVNLSASSISDPAFVPFLAAECARCRVDPSLFCFEIAETVATAQLGRVRDFMLVLRASGVRFALDDYGSGLSSLAYLATLPLSYVKIDGLFVRGLADKPVHQAMLAGIQGVSRALGLLTIAECVEDAATLAAVAALGIDFAQGHAVGAAHA